MLSMTGYGRGHSFCNGRDMVVEIKTVNHRFMDFGFRLPHDLMYLENTLREKLTMGGLIRGHADVTVTYRNQSEGSTSFQIDKQRLSAFEQAVQAIKPYCKGYRKMSVAELLVQSGAMKTAIVQDDPDKVRLLAEEACEQALTELQAMRQREGNHLRCDLFEKLEELEQIRQHIAERAPEVPLAYRSRLQERLREWQLEESTDPQRLAQEVAIMADKCAIDEEISRLQGHILQFRQIADASDETGKKLDFLIQEMNREMNTMGSKASDDLIIRYVVDGKCVIEKLREQVQNAV